MEDLEAWMRMRDAGPTTADLGLQLVSTHSVWSLQPVPAGAVGAVGAVEDSAAYKREYDRCEERWPGQAAG